MFDSFSDNSSCDTTNGIYGLLASGGQGSLFSRTAGGTTRSVFTLDDFVACHLDAVGSLLSPEFGLRELVKLRGEKDDAGSIFNPRYTDSSEDEESSSDHEGTVEPNAQTRRKELPEKKTWRSRRRIVISTSMPASGRRSEVELCDALHTAAMLRDVAPPSTTGDCDSERRETEIANRRLLARCMTALVQEQTRACDLPQVAASLSPAGDTGAGAAAPGGDRRLTSAVLWQVVREHLTRPFECEPSEGDLERVLETLVMPVAPLLYPVRPILAKGILDHHHSHAAAILDLPRTVLCVELTRWRLLDAWIEGRMQAFMEGSVRQLGQRLARLKLLAGDRTSISILKGCATQQAQAPPATSSEAAPGQLHPALEAMFGSALRMESAALRLVGSVQRSTERGEGYCAIDQLMYWEVVVAALEASQSASAAR